MSRVQGVGAIGAGQIFGEHASALRSLRDQVALVAVADLDPVTLQQATEAAFVPYATVDHRELLARDDVDVVLICTPPSSHAALVAEALAAGKRVVCEKPLAHTLADADRIVALAEQHPGRVSVVHQLRYDSAYRRLLWLHEEGALGRMLYASVQRVCRVKAQADAAWWGRWSVAGGGTVMSQFIHELDLICALFGQPVRVLATLGTLDEAHQAEDCFSAGIWFADGGLVNCSASSLGLRMRGAFSVVAEHGVVEVPWRVDLRGDPAVARAVGEAERRFPAPRTARLSLPRRAVNKARRLAGWQPPTPPSRPHGWYWQAVLQAIRDDAPLPVGPAVARASIALCRAIYLSALEGGPVTLPLEPSAGCYTGVDASQYDALRAGQPGRP